MNDQAQGEPPDPPPLDPQDQPPVDRYCDVVLTGGVTDGVVYPWALMELARKYRFKNIGGTSVGAMAAALTAAAEYRRRLGSVSGFNQVLLELPRKLGEDNGGSTKLFSLFQPAETTRRLFGLFLSLFRTDAGANKKSALLRFLSPNRRTGAEGLPGRLVLAVKDRMRWAVFSVLRTRKRYKPWKGVLGVVLARWPRKIPNLLFAVLAAYRGPATFGVLIGVLIGAAVWWHGHLASAYLLVAELAFSAVPSAIVSAAVLVGIALYRDTVHGLVPNGFGLCTGGRENQAAEGPQPLVEWLHEGIQAAADKPLDQPLTFKDLWNAPGGPVVKSMPPAAQTRKPRSIDLQMVTTNLTHGRPYGLPIEDQTSRLFFKTDELRPYFPESILDYLVAHSRPYVRNVPESDPDPKNVPADLRELPAGELPIVVAARMSLSFPVLLSAVPLWAIDYESPLETRRLRKCWFSDGGICSNFPIHLFDSAIPEWPTFGISLAQRSLFRSKQPVWLTRHHLGGRADSWDRFGDERLPLTGKSVLPLGRLLGFVLAIIGTAKDWNDNTSMRMPGVRDRVVHVALETDEGGLNLEMTGAQILKFARVYGQPAGKKLVDKFINPAPGNAPSQAWKEHRWVRFNTFLVALRERIEAITAAAELSPYAEALSAQIAHAQLTRPLAGKDPDGAPLTPAQAADLQNLLIALRDLESGFAQADMPQPYTPLPTPTMRIRPPL